MKSRALTTFRKVDGRTQEVLINRNIGKLNLFKNPSAANLTLSEFLRTNEKKQLIFRLNDLPAYGEDISWISDIEWNWLISVRNVDVLEVGNEPMMQHLG